MGDLRQRLKTAVDATPVPLGLETRVLARVRAARPGRPMWLLPAFGAITMAAVFAFVYTSRNEDAYMAQISSTVPTLMKIGLGDHIHCAVFRKYSKTQPTAAEFVESIGPMYAELVGIVQKNTPLGYRMLLAHQCTYMGRQFIHITLGNDSHLLSLVITPKREAETLTTGELKAALTDSGVAFYAASADKFGISAFESMGYLVYFVSDLPADQNSDMLRAMAAAIRGVLEKA